MTLIDKKFVKSEVKTFADIGITTVELTQKRFEKLTMLQLFYLQMMSKMKYKIIIL